MSRQDLKDAGLKVTSPRVLILKLLDESKTPHMTAEDVYKTLLDKGEEIGLATVYRVLSQFEEVNLVTRHMFEEGKAVFERNTGGHHDHMVCMETGKVIEFMDDAIERLQHEIAEKHGYELVDHNMVLYVRPKESD